jgi:serine/threonine-protein kinase
VEERLMLDRYRVLAELGSGGHGSVTLAFDTKLARRVAIKHLPLAANLTSGARRREGLAEARTAGMLNHPNIVTVHEWDSDDEGAYIVMEDVDGLSLADVLDASAGPLDIDEAAAVVEAVAGALAFAHENGVLHLDLKPSNVLLCRDGRVKVSDFGISALTGPDGMARGGAGTPGYMPPEQIRDERLDRRTDVWALAALAYETLANANPFDSDTPEGSLFKIEVADVPAPSEFEADLPAGVDDVLLAALDPEPENRYPSVSEFAQALLPRLGDPRRGHASLAARVEALAAEAREADEAYALPGLWDRLARYAPSITRALAGVACAWLGWVGLDVLLAETAPLLAATAMIGLAGVLAPGLGLALGFGAVIAGVWTAAGPTAGLIATVAAVVFWVLVGRRGGGDAVTPVFAPVLALARAAFALPLLLGFVFEPLRAALAGAVAGLVLAAVSLAGATGPPLASVTPALLIEPFALFEDGSWALPAGLSLQDLALGAALIAVTWALAAAASSVGSRRLTRAGAIAGALIGGLILGGGYSLWRLLPGGVFGPGSIAPDIVIGVFITVAIAALGPPTRPETAFDEPEFEDEGL